MSSTTKRVLSIQSHVVSGYVGNKAATFPLQLLGYETDCINSVNFSNHTGYGRWKGTAMNGQELVDLITGLQENGIAHYDYLLTGYIGCETLLRQIALVVKELKTINPDLTYVCDTVMGDDGVGLYISPSLVPVYRELVVPVADILTPNAFEAEQLTGLSISSIEDAVKVLDALHSMSGAHTVVITSSHISNDKENIYLFGSDKSRDTKFWFAIPLLKNSFTGTGDLFTSLLLAWYGNTEGNLVEAVQKVLGTMQSVLRNTNDYAEHGTGSDNKIGAKYKELRLIQSKDVIENAVKRIMNPNERSEEKADWWGWGAGIYHDLQKQTEELIVLAKQDLGEFVDTVATESQAAAKETVKVVAKHVPIAEAESLLSTLDLNGRLSMPEAKNSNTEVRPAPVQRLSSRNKPPVRYTRRDMYILQLQSSPVIFINEPDNSVAFAEWETQNSNLEQRITELGQLRSNSLSLANMESNLVPNVVTHDLFWKRYFFHVDQFDKSQLQREEIKRAMETDIQKPDHSEDWGDDDTEESDMNDNKQEDETLNSLDIHLPDQRVEEEKSKVCSELTNTVSPVLSQSATQQDDIVEMGDDPEGPSHILSQPCDGKQGVKSVDNHIASGEVGNLDRNNDSEEFSIENGRLACARDIHNESMVQNAHKTESAGETVEKIQESGSGSDSEWEKWE
eukprot:CFRG5434T1